MRFNLFFIVLLLCCCVYPAELVAQRVIKPTQIKKLLKRPAAAAEKPAAAKILPAAAEILPAAVAETPAKAPEKMLSNNLEKAVLGQKFIDLRQQTGGEFGVAGLLKRADYKKDYILRSRVLNRVEYLIENQPLIKETFLRKTQFPLSLMNPHNETQFGIHYYKNIKAASVVNFQPQDIFAYIEVKLYSRDFIMHRPLRAASERLAANEQAKRFFLSRNEDFVRLKLNKGTSSENIKELYKALLGCSPGKPCHFDFVGSKTLRLFSPDQRYWLRIGEHELRSFEVHLHWNTYVDLRMKNKDGMFVTERVVANYTLPIWFLRNLRDPKGRDIEGAYKEGMTKAERDALRQQRLTDRFDVFIFEAIDAMQAEGSLVRLPMGRTQF